MKCKNTTGLFALGPFMRDTCVAYHQHGEERCYRDVYEKAQNDSTAATKGGCSDLFRPVLKPCHSIAPTPSAKSGTSISNNPWTTTLFAPQYDHHPQSSVHADTPVLGKSVAPATGLANSTNTPSPSSSSTEPQSSRAPFGSSTWPPSFNKLRRCAFGESSPRTRHESRLERRRQACWDSMAVY